MKPDERSLQAQGERVLAAALDLAAQGLRERLVAAYALGSLAHGGFSGVSDVDLGLVIAAPLLGSDDGLVAGMVKHQGSPAVARPSCQTFAFEYLASTHE